MEAAFNKILATTKRVWEVGDEYSVLAYGAVWSPGGNPD
jgi:hypothetical protein